MELDALPDELSAAHGSKPAHRSVLGSEIVEWLRPHPGGFLAVDCTLGAGGHSESLLAESSPDGELVALDADAEALDLAARRLAPFGSRVRLVHSNFRDLARVASDLSLTSVDAVLFDLGLSSMQLERSGRGFSFRLDEPLDMRFTEPADTPTAADLLNSLSAAELERIVREYGEEPRARRVARAIVRQRERAELQRTGDLVAAVERALGPARGRIHPATRVFQAVRIAVNNELEALHVGLNAGVRLLSPGGRMAAISFHSLEDRMVKWRFRGWAAPEDGGQPLVTILTRKPVVPGPAERGENPRARSAKLRVVERTSAPLTAAMSGESGQ